MKRFLLYCGFLLVVTVGLALINDGLIYMMTTSSSGSSAYKMKRLFSEDHFDEIPILGSSRAKENFVPSIIATNCFDYGENGQGFAETLMHLKHVLTRPGSGLVIVNVDPWGSFRTGDDFRCDYRFANQGAVRAALLKGMKIPDVDWTDRFPGLRFAGSLRSAFATWMNERKSTTRVVDNGAMLLKYVRTQDEMVRAETALGDVHFTFNDEMRDAISAVVSLNREKTICWVVSPVSDAWRRHFVDECSFSDYLTMLKSFPRTVLIDFHNEHFQDGYFKDTTHMNYDGARDFSARLAKRVNQIRR